MMEKHSNDQVPLSVSAEQSSRKENAICDCDLETDARLASPRRRSAPDIHPLKREVKLHKSPVQDFGTSLCMLHGDIFVTDVRKGSPAWQIGLQPGDRIEAIDDVHIRPDEFHRRRVLPQKIISYLRTHADLEVKVCDQPVTRIHHVPACHYDGDDIGLEYLNSVITKVEPERAASSAGIRTGESILEVNDELMIGRSDDEVVQQIEALRYKGEVEVKTVPADLALEMVWAKTMLETRDEDATKRKTLRDGCGRRYSLPHLLLLG